MYQKRLIGGGFEKIYTLGPNFRNEGIDDEHLPEYYQLEWYWAYADYRDNMRLVRNYFFTSLGNYMEKQDLRWGNMILIWRINGKRLIMLR